MAFYAESEDGVHGLYYKDAWTINIDWSRDKYLDIGQIPTTFTDYKDVEQFSTTFITKNFRVLDQYGKSHSKSVIDTTTETIDSHLQVELETKLKAIIIDELSARTEANQQKIKNQISDFVQQQAKEGSYVELPYFLLLEARKAGL